MGTSDSAAAVAGVYETWMRTVDAAGPMLARLGLTPATFQALWVIDPDEPPPSMKVMAERLHCNAPNLTFIADQLVDRRLVERAVDPTDRRSRVLVLTSKGRHVRDEVVRTALAQSPLANLTGEELGQLGALLERALQPSHARKTTPCTT